LCEKYCLSYADVQSLLYDSRYESKKEEISEVIDSRNENLTEKDTISSHYDKAVVNSSRFYYNDTYGSSTTGNTDYGSIVSSFATPTVKVKRASQTSTFSSISEISERHRHSNQYQGSNKELMGRIDNIQSHSRIDSLNGIRHSQRVNDPQNTGNRKKEIPLSDRKVLVAERENDREKEVIGREGGKRPKDSGLALCDSGTDDTTKSSCQRRGQQEACEEEKSDWIEMYDDANKRLYYYNSQEQYSSWTPPQLFQRLRRSAYGSPSTSVVSTPALTPSLPGYLQGSDSSKQRRDSNGYTYESSCSPTIVTLQTVDMSFEKAESVSSIDGHSVSRSSERRKLRAYVKEERRLQMKERRDYFLGIDLIQDPLTNDSLEGEGHDQEKQRYVVPSSSGVEESKGRGQGQGQGKQRYVVPSSSGAEESQGHGQEKQRYVVPSSSGVEERQGQGHGQGQEKQRYVVPSSSGVEERQGHGQGHGQGQGQEKQRYVVPSSSGVEERQGQGHGQGHDQEKQRYVLPSPAGVEERQGQGHDQEKQRYVVPSSSGVEERQGHGHDQGQEKQRYVVPSSSGVEERQGQGHGQEKQRYVVPSSSGVEERQGHGQGHGQGHDQEKQRYVVPSSSGVEERQGQGHGQGQEKQRYVVPSSSGVEERQGQGHGQGKQRYVVPSSTTLELVNDAEMPHSTGKCSKDLTGQSPLMC
jgi:hypothetical protein